MNIVLSTTVLASVLAPAFSFSYLDSLGGAAPAVAAPAAAAPAAAAPAAPAAPYESGFAEVKTTAGNYHDSLNVGTPISGPGMMTHAETLNTGVSTLSGAGMQTYASALLPSNIISGGAGIQTHTDSLSPSSFNGASFSPFGASASFSTGSSSSGGVSFTLQTGDISGLVNNLGPGGTLRLTGSIDDISYN